VLAGPGGHADVLLLDLNLHGHRILDRVGQLAAAGHRVIVFSQFSEPETVLAVIDAGAAFLAKDEGGEHCVKTIVAAAADRPYVPPSVAGAIVADSNPLRPRLSEKEETALLLWFQSMSKASVAQRMNLKMSTVKQYIDRARVKYAKTGRPAATKTALLARAIEDGLIRADEVGEYTSRAASPPAGR
jgi:DNA-binding NarL/FixJ family response regulator